MSEACKKAIRTLPPLPPESKGVMRCLYHEDEVFRELCADYTECSVVLARLRREQAETDPRIEQYGELHVSLERELLSKISEAAVGKTEFK